MMIPYFEGLQIRSHGHVPDCWGERVGWTATHSCLSFIAAGASG